MAEEQDLGTLTRLRDTDETIANTSTDIRGLEVIDTEGTTIGRVDGLFLDEREHEIRFMEVASGGFLGIGRTKVVIPIDAIENIESASVRINQSRERVAGAPAYDPDLTPSPLVADETYGYYGFLPFWGAGYIYPTYSGRP